MSISNVNGALAAYQYAGTAQKESVNRITVTEYLNCGLVRKAAYEANR